MKIKLEALKNAFSTVDWVSPNPVLESSQFVRLAAQNKKLHLHLSGALIAGASISATDETWSVYLERRALKTFLSTAREEEIEIAVKDKKITLRCGQTLDLPSHAAVSGYQSWKPKNGKTITVDDDQKKLIALLLRYAPVLPGMTQYSAVSFSKSGALATDTVNICQIDCVFAAPILLPKESAEVFVKTPGAWISDDTGIGIQTSNGFIYQAKPSDLDNYPLDACQAALAKSVKQPPLFSVAASDLLEPLKTANAFVDGDLPATLKLSKSTGTILAEMQSGGKFQRAFKLASPIKSDLELRVTINDLLPWVSAIAVADVVEYARIEKDDTTSTGINIFTGQISGNASRLLFADK